MKEKIHLWGPRFCLLFAMCWLSLTLTGCADFLAALGLGQDGSVSEGLKDTLRGAGALAATFGGPWGYIGSAALAAIAPLWRWSHHKKNAIGLIRAVQEGRRELEPAARLALDNKMRDVMENTIPGNVREYVRKNKALLKKTGVMALERLSDRHAGG